MSEGDQQQFLCKHWACVALGAGWQSSRRDEGIDEQEEVAEDGRTARRSARKREKDELK